MKKTSIIGIVIIAVVIGVVVSTYADSSSYSTFAEARTSQAETHVVGTLDKTHDLIYNPQQNANLFTFYMQDNDHNNCRVEFIGAKPQDFERSEQIVLTGSMKGEVFQASKILMKCPSKYNKDQVEVSSK